MIAVNGLNDLDSPCSHKGLQTFVTLLSPYAPHLAEALWAELSGDGLVIDAAWPKANPDYLVVEEVVYPISFNGKMRFKLTFPASTSPEEVESAVKTDERTIKQLDGREIRKIIVIPGRIVNIVG